MQHWYRLYRAGTLSFLTFSLLASIPAAGQSSGARSPACQVTQFRLEIVTGGDDLRGGQDNLNIEVHWFDGQVQAFTNVNHSANWGNNTTHMVDLELRRPTAANQISFIRLIHLAQSEVVISPDTVASPLGPASAIKTQDNWDMAEVVVSAMGSGLGVKVAQAGPYRFTGDNTKLSVNLKFPRSVCGSDRTASRDRARPGSAMTNQDVVRMTRAGVPESAILAAIHQANTRFDFSPGSQQELNQAGVSPALQRAMREQGAPAADDLNPQPYPPNASGATRLSAAAG
ncbi:MAG: hypothetical protein ACRD2D_13285 [Terriglobales bacterium]